MNGSFISSRSDFMSKVTVFIFISLTIYQFLSISGYWKAGTLANSDDSDLTTLVVNGLLEATIRYTWGVHLNVALRFCKAHYMTYLYFPHFNRFQSLLRET